MLGTVSEIKDSFGFVTGGDGVQRFFIPSFLKHGPVMFDSLRVGDRVQFDHADHPRGPRAVNIDRYRSVPVDFGEDE